MTLSTRIHAIVPGLVIIAMAALLSACGGGGDGLATRGSEPVAFLVSAGGVQAALWQGAAVGPPLCAGPVFQNSPLVFSFGGPVDPASVPAGPFATGSIAITGSLGGPATGAFAVEDEPGLPSGNQRRIVFRPPVPGSAAGLGTTGFMGSDTYTISVPAAGAAGPVLRVAGADLTTPILTCFTTCDPTPAGCYADPAAGPPHVVLTLPGTADPAPAPIDLRATPVARFSIMWSEPLRPVAIDVATVRLVHLASGAQVPGTVEFFQAGNSEAGPTGARVDYVPSGPLLFGSTYELVVGPEVTDLTGNAAQLWRPGDPAAPASGRRLFATLPDPFCAQPPHDETFDTTANRASVAGAANWEGSGALTMSSSLELLGTGAFGPLIITQAATLDAGQPPMVAGGQVAFQDGVWHTTQIQVAAGVIVRVVATGGSLRRAHFRCLGSVDIQGTLDGSAGGSPYAPLGDPEQGPRNGYFNNGQGFNTGEVAGGVGGVGGGAGGWASTGPGQRALSGERGYGPPDAGVVNSGPFGANPFFGGGQGGEGGYRYPQAGVPGELGGLGGAGGSAFGSGGNGGPTSLAPNCAPVNPAVQARALATGQPAVFAPPVSVASAGSGGGGGGDHFEVAGYTSDDQGGGGGGGGGGIRISALGAITIAGGASVLCRGANGATGNILWSGGGGGGSGGEIWLQSFSDVVIGSTAFLQVDGGTGPQACTDHSAGAGGLGLYQFEDLDGAVNTLFVGAPTGGTNIVVLPLPHAVAFTGIATSVFLDAGYGAPDYVAPDEVFSLGNISGGAVEIRYQGAYELVSGGGPDLGTLTAPVPASQMDQLDGRRYVRFVATLSYPSTPPPPQSAILPSVDRITIRFNAPLNCVQ